MLNLVYCKKLPDVSKLVKRLHQVGLHHGVTESSDVDDWGRRNAVTVLYTILQRERKYIKTTI